MNVEVTDSQMSPQEREIQREAEKLLNVTPRGSRVQDSVQIAAEYSVLRFFGEILVLTTLCSLIFTILLLLKIEKHVSWAYWWIFAPVGIFLFVILIFTQSKRLAQQAPLITRLAWLFCV
jgi:hypothetical protein